MKKKEALELMKQNPYLIFEHSERKETLSEKDNTCLDEENWACLNTHQGRCYFQDRC